MRPPAMVISIVLAVASAGCGLCEHESVQLSFAGTATGDGASEAVTGLQAVSTAHISDYQPLRDFLIDGVDPGGRAATWTVGLIHYGFLSVTLPTSVRRGDRLPLAGVPRPGTWGLAPSTDSRVLASLQSVDGTFVTATAQGTLTVIGTDPLRLRVDGVFANAAGSTRALSGEATFEEIREERECYT
jgi:hypothetical protein